MDAPQLFQRPGLPMPVLRSHTRVQAGM